MLLLPDIIETVGRNKRAFSLPSKLYEQGIITLMDEINDDLAYVIITQLLYLDSIDTQEPVKLYVNSPGGSVTAGLAIIDTIHAMERKVQTIGMGMCASMGAMILLSGTGERKALKNTRIMLHSVSGGTRGTVHDQIIDLEETKFLQDQLMQMIAKSSKNKMTLQDVKEFTQRDFYISSEKAVELGIIDSVI